MKRLIKKSKHDMPNRDDAVLYVDGQFYEDVNHALCIRKFLKDNNDENIKNVFLGDLIDILIEMRYEEENKSK